MAGGDKSKQITMVNNSKEEGKVKANANNEEKKQKSQVLMRPNWPKSHSCLDEGQWCTIDTSTFD